MTKQQSDLKLIQNGGSNTITIAFEGNKDP